MDQLQGEQYVRLAPGTAERVAPYLGVPAAGILELVLELEHWPERLRPAPVRARDGRLLTGDPVLLDADDRGLTLAGDAAGRGATLVLWHTVRGLRVLEPPAARLGA